MGQNSCVSFILLVVLSVVLVSCFNNQHDSVQRMVIEGPDKSHVLGVSDSGHAVNCGTAKLNLTWTPKDLAPTGQVTVYLDYTLPYDFDAGFINASLYFHGEKDPFLGYADSFTCSDIQKYIPFQYHIYCPLRAHMPFKFDKTITNLHALTSYPGTYDAVVELKNSHKQQLFCLNVTVHITEI